MKRIDTITKELKKMLKSASTVCFRTNEEEISTLELKKEINIDGFKTDVWEYIHVDVKFDDYERGYEFERAFHSNNFAQYDLVWQTVVQNIKVGDTLKFEWRIGNKSNVMEEHNLIQDELFLIIQRDNKQLKFMIDTMVTNRDSIARMCKMRKSLNIAQ